MRAISTAGGKPIVRLQPNRDYLSNDCVQTPPELARRLANHFKPAGRILEPCRGDGNFLRCLPKGTEWCEIKEGRDFYAWDKPVDWIITNPPWSEIRRFLQHAMQHADHVVFLLTINHIWTQARLRDISAAGFGLKQIVLVDMPQAFPTSGFQLGAVHVARDWTGPIQLVDFTTKKVKARRKKSVAVDDRPLSAAAG
jgi:hypothetical protein